jgi:hypothetical protein
VIGSAIIIFQKNEFASILRKKAYLSKWRNTPTLNKRLQVMPKNGFKNRKHFGSQQNSVK